ncbi:relaxase domain-containing protein [Spirosoma sp. HMF4905]|uniref:Relaxase domain-containing protein n=2 Tax=Spirosoma arboris TaxID=2682092 RepID=A0A7K1SKX1_9BACT|nr:relaxase domain-containing protein [Spirosoma arboris]
MIQSSSAAHAKDYFTGALVKADYYLSDQDQEYSGRLQGKLAERIGITGSVTQDTFFALCENVNPVTGGTLTPRTKEERTTGYDINFHCPKSVSILHVLSNDTHIRDAFEEAVRLTMLDMEADSRTRVRKKGANNERDTSELIWADFIHQTARPVGDHLPDPHLHAHCFVFNATWDKDEKQMKAVQFRDIKRDMPYYQARFHKRLSDQLIEQGYQIRRTGKSFEIEGVPEPVIDLFSKRTDEIGRVAKEKGITDAKELSELGARTRAKKQKGHSMADLKADWRRQIEELGSTGKGKRIIRFAPAKEKQDFTPEHCVDHAIQHDFERASVMHDRRLLATAYRHSIGHVDVSLDTITDRLEADERLIQVEEKGRMLCTTRQVLAEEQQMVRLARLGQGKLKPLYTKAPALKLDGQQADAVRHVLTSPHRVSIIRGAAGSGKTTLMHEAIEKIKQAGKRVTVVAPSSQASRGVLREEGFENAQTVAQLLADETMQQNLAGQVLWVDEAGLLGTQDMTCLLALANQKNARLILGGDTRQHASVVRGDALRIINTVGGIQTAEVSKIYRQKDEAYRHAVEDLAKGDMKNAFGKLDMMGSIQEIDPLQPNDTLVEDYVAAVRQGKSALVISPTHQQSEVVTEAIREKLKTSGLLGKKEIKASRLANMNLTEAQKCDWRNFQSGQIIQFNQNLPGIKRGSVWIVESSSENGIFIQNDEQQSIALPLHKSRDYDVYQKRDIHLSKGDQVRITRNGFDQDKKRLNNGQLLDVVKVSKHGEIVLRNSQSKAAYRLSQDYGHLVHAYCLTSHASQGKTVDEVFISQPASTFPGTDAKQFYVSVSRGRYQARIYTDDKAQLLDFALRDGDRKSALELVGQTEELVHQHIRNTLSRTSASKAVPNVRPKASPTKDRDYGPRL